MRHLSWSWPHPGADLHLDLDVGEVAQLRELGHDDRAVAVRDRLAVDLWVQTVAAADLEIDGRAVRGASRLLLDVRKVAAERNVHGDLAVALRLFDVVADECL